MGIYLTSLFIKYVVRDNISHGITRVLYAISTKKSRLKGHNCWSSVVASGITIGFGGSVGAEAPIVLTGSAIGSNLGQIFRMDKKTMMLLVGCGSQCRHCRRVQGTDSRTGVHPRGADGRSEHGIALANLDFVRHSYLFHLYIQWRQFAVRFHAYQPMGAGTAPRRAFCWAFSAGPVSLYFMRTMSVCEGFFAKLSQYPYRQTAVWGTHPEHAHLPLPVALWRGLFCRQHPAQG